jgi:F420-dependent oxidoreductase-like protein
VIGVYVPGSSANDFIANIKLAESNGVPAFWLTSGGLLPDVVTVFAAASRETESIKLGTSITQTWPRHPIAIASQCIAMHQLAPGRFRIGLGPSHQPAVEGMYGVEYKKPLLNLREYLYTVQAILKQGEVSYDGTYVKTTARLSAAGPGGFSVAAPVEVPVMASALRPASFRLCGELADGAISWVCPWEYLRDIALPAMKEGSESAGRATPPLVAHIPVVLSDQMETVREAAGPGLSRYAGLTNYRGMFEAAGFHDAAGGELNALIDAVAVYGTDEAVADRLASIIGDGAGEIIAHQMPVPDADRGGQTQRFLEVVAEANKLARVTA